MIVDDLSGLQRRLAADFESRAAEAIAARGRFVVALPGGSVARAFFPTLALKRVDWARTEFFWIDERAVPPQDAESNYALASTLWLMPARVPASRIHRFHAELADLDRVAQVAADELVAAAGDPPRLDMALIGVGEDGHVASIFPDHGSPADRYATAVYDAPKPPHRRLTLTMPVLSGAERVVVAALGISKADVIREALTVVGGTTPVAELLRASKSTLVLLDREAASQLPLGITNRDGSP